MLHESRVVTVSIERSWQAVYDFARAPRNLPKWASGLAAGVWQDDGEWYADAPMGRVKVRMTGQNPFGVLDHDVTLPDGTLVRNAFRVSPNKDGCDAVFVVHRTEGVDRDAFERDVAHVAADLQALKRLLEQRESDQHGAGAGLHCIDQSGQASPGSESRGARS